MPIAAALTPMAPVAVVPVTLTSSPVPALPVMLPPGLPPLVQATTEVDELSESFDTKELAPRVGAALQAGVTDGTSEPQQQPPTRKGPATGTAAFSPPLNTFCAVKRIFLARKGSSFQGIIPKVILEAKVLLSAGKWAVICVSCS